MATQLHSDRRTPALLTHRDVMAIRGLPHRLREQKMTQAAESIENVLTTYDALRDFVVVQETPMIAAAIAGQLPAPLAAVGPRRRRWLRRAA